MRSLGNKKLTKKTDNPRGYTISFRVSEGLYKALCLKANEDARFRRAPNLYARYLLEKGFEPSDIKSLKTLSLTQNELLQKIINRCDIIQVTLESLIKYELGHHPEPPIEEVEMINNLVENKFETLLHIIIRDLQKRGNTIQRIIADQITG